MNDMRDYINKAIAEVEEELRQEKGKEVKLTDSEKKLIEYGYTTAALDMAWKIHEEEQGKSDNEANKIFIGLDLASKPDCTGYLCKGDRR